MFDPACTPFLEHLDTNYAPSDDEVPEIRSLIQENDEALAELIAQIKALEVVQTARICFRERHSALLSPIKSLPGDILSALFVAIVAHPSQRHARMTSSHPAVILSHVCRRWRQLALSTPTLWNKLTIHSPPTPTAPTPGNILTPDASRSLIIAQLPEVDRCRRWERELELIKTTVHVWLKRSKGSDLFIQFQAADPVAAGHRYHPQGAMKSPPAATVSSLVDIICNVSSRWKEATIRLTGSGFEKSAFRRIFELREDDVPHLQRLALSATFAIALGPTGDHLPPPNQDTGILGARLLSSLSLGPTFAAFNTLPVRWRQLTNLQIHGLPSITNGAKAFGFSEALALLRACPQLVACDLTFNVGASNGGMSGGRVSLPHLKSLTLRHFVPNHDFIALLFLPSLKALSLPNDLGPSSPGHSATEAWLEAFGHQLTDVHLNAYNLTQSGLLRCMNLLLNVVSLRLAHNIAALFLAAGVNLETPLDGDFLRRLTPSFGEGNVEGWHCCPKLEAIELPIFAGEEALFQFIAQRRRAHSSGNLMIARLRKVTVKFETVKELDIANALREDGVDISDLALKLTYPLRIPLRQRAPFGDDGSD
ncbi:hypothetical protein D9611_005423 [Ephemerocybe angulata]|uniref:F-box domain-containing protein n=1 Tax=Ephemerocybe angulata TaxID=980116 RepID=A0A8H5FDP2_9AGAR|nr:hypothetical protein D9611_005423 [Tulosesus angulatus]